MIKLHLKKSIFSEKFYKYLYDYNARWECYCGSAGSGKSYFITLKLILRALKEPITILVCRRYGTTIRNSVFSLFKDIIKKWHLQSVIKINESDYRITFNNESKIIFVGLDDESKLLSLNDISCVWVEEATEVDREVVEQLNLRMRGKADNQLILMSWNPISESHWLYEFTQLNPPESFRYIHSTYKDNKWLSDDYIKSLEELKTRNPKKWKVYGLGEWGTDTDGLVFSNWEIQLLNAQELAQKYLHRCGMDFGYNDPSAIVESFYNKENNIIYITQCYYARGLQLSDLLRAIRDLGIQKSKIQCDSAEPRTIDYFRKQGIPAVPCIKGLNSVNARILFLQNNKIIVDPSCKDVIEELNNFSYIKDKKTNKYTDDTTHEYSHSIDALGYAYSDVYKHKKLRTLEKGVLGL